MAKKHDLVLNNVLEKITPKKEEMEKMELISLMKNYCFV